MPTKTRQPRTRSSHVTWAPSVMLAALCACSQSATDSPNEPATAKDTAEVLKVVAASAPIEFRGTCDGSAAALLSNGQLVVANDEDAILRFYNRDGTKLETEFNLESDLSLEKGAEPDIEGAAVDGERIYWITSHGRNSKAELKPERFRLFATTRGDPLAVVGEPFSDLMSARSLGILGFTEDEPLAPEKGGINIEAIATRADGSVLLGLRSPLRSPDGKSSAALVIPLTNAAALVGRVPAGAQRPEPQFGTPMPMDIGNRGIRDMIRFRDGYLLIAGNVASVGPFDLFQWSGAANSKPVHLGLLEGLNAEALVDLGEGDVLVLSDEGDTPLAQYGNTICKDLGKVKKKDKPKEGETQEAFEQRKALERSNRSFKGRIYRIAVQT